MKALNLVALALICITCIVLAVEALPYFLPPSVDVEITTDKEIYHSGDRMNITVSLESSKGVDNVDINIEGIKSNRGIYKISRSMNKNLTAGENNISFEYITPSCGPCSGINKGAYFINTTVSYGEDITNSSHSIIIE